MSTNAPCNNTRPFATSKRCGELVVNLMGAEHVVKGSASDWARLAVRRIAPDKTRLKTSGEAAEIAVQVVRAYL